MPLTTVSASRISAASAYSFAVDNSDVVVLPGVTVASTGAAGLSATGSSSDFTVFGAVSGATFGIRLGDAATDAGNTLRLGDLATVFGATTGVAFTGRSGLIDNRGDIYAQGTGILLNVGATGTVTARNYGLVTADTAVDASASTGTVRFVNSGTLQGETAAYLGGGGADLFTNRGTLEGDILLGAGNDVFTQSNFFYGIDANGGLVDGGAGNDRFAMATASPGPNPATYAGGAGTDTLDLSRGTFVVADLALPNFTSIEVVIGGSNADALSGDDLANTLIGGEGSDTLSGRGGADLLVIEDGDRAQGGAGSDTFRFAEPGANAFPAFDTPRILDWSSVSGNDDRIQVSAAGFGGGLVAGAAITAAQFQSSTSPIAAGAAVRFIWDRDNRGLYFDADGSGTASQAVIVATFDGTAPVTAADILVIA